MSSSLADAMRARPVVLDGGLATRLEERGHDLSDDLWSARLLVDDPAEVVAAHFDYFAAGAEIATTTSYQVSYQGLAKRGLDHADTDKLLRRSVELGPGGGLAVRRRPSALGGRLGRPLWSGPGRRVRIHR